MEIHAIQEEWLRNHPQHAKYEQLPVVTTQQWADHIWIMPDGREVTEEPRQMNFGGVRLVSAANTLYVDPCILHAARKYDVV